MATKPRKSRAGQTGKTGHYVRRRESVHRVVRTGRPPEQQDDDVTDREVEPPHTTRKGVTLPALKCLEKKRIAGELI